MPPADFLITGIRGHQRRQERRAGVKLMPLHAQP